MWPTVLKRAVGKNRVNLNDMEVAAETLKAINVPDNATIIEISPGTGFLTRALLQHTNARKILALERDKKYVDEPSILAKLAKESNGRLEVFNVDTWQWITYDMIKYQLTSLQIHPWEEVHPNLISIIHLPNTTKGELVINKLLSNCYNKIGLHCFGRSRMNFIVPEKAAEKLLAKKGEIQRHRINIELESIVETEILKIFPKNAFLPNIQCALFGVTPLIEPKLQAQWHTFQHVMKGLMSRKNAKLVEMLSTLGAGANILAKELSFDPNLSVRDMSAENYNEVSVLFENWPFRPGILNDDDYEMPRRPW